LTGRLTVEDSPLAGLALVEGGPLADERTNVRLFGIGHRVVRQRPLRLYLPPLAALSGTHTIIAQVAQANHGAAPNATDHHNLADLAHDIVALDAIQLAARSLGEHPHNEAEKLIQRL